MKKRWSKKDIDFPCKEIGFCPYGFLVEEYPVREKNTEITCPVFGHECPAYFVAEGLSKEMWKRLDGTDTKRDKQKVQK